MWSGHRNYGPCPVRGSTGIAARRASSLGHDAIPGTPDFFCSAPAAGASLLNAIFFEKINVLHRKSPGYSGDRHGLPVICVIVREKPGFSPDPINFLFIQEWQIHSSRGKCVMGMPV
jgi:hypothetical protein